MKTGDVGERGFLKDIQDLVRQVSGSRLGFNEDASDLPCGPGVNMVVNVDTFVQSTDRLPGMTDAQVGRKAAVMTMSDLVAKGVRPAANMMSICLPNDYPLDDAIEMVRGFSDYGLKNGAPLIGGDTGSASEPVLTGISMGLAAPDMIVTRGGSQVGDTIVVTDAFGLTSVAYRVLLKGMEASAATRDNALEAAYRPELHFGLVEALAKSGAVSSSMDSSDGLGITLNTMSGLSQHEFLIETLPAASGLEDFARQHDLNPTDLVMNGGEEFSLVLTIPSRKVELAATIARRSRTSLWVIGHVSAGGPAVRLLSGGEETVIADKGYDNFREWK